MKRTLVLVTFVGACGCPDRATLASPTTPLPTSRLEVVVVREYTRGCPHPITLEIDGILRSNVTVPCAVRSNGMMVAVDTNAKFWRAPSVWVPPGRHQFVARDIETGHSMVLDVELPVYDGYEGRSARLAQTFPIRVRDQEIRIAQPVFDPVDW